MASRTSVWFLSFHCFTKYVKVTFFRGTSLSPVPAGPSKHPEVRYLDIYEDQLDEPQFIALGGASQPAARRTGCDEATKRCPQRRKATSMAPASELIDARIEELTDWRGETLARTCEACIRQADPEVVEEWKWRGVPVVVARRGSSAPARPTRPS